MEEKEQQWRESRPRRSISRPQRSVSRPRRSVSRQHRSVSRQRPAVEVQHPAAGEPSQSVEEPRQSVEEPRQSSKDEPSQSKDEPSQSVDEARQAVRPWDVHYFIYTWLNKAFNVPPKPLNPRTFYPWSSSLALEYRAKLAIVLMNLVAAFFLAEKPCDRVALLFNCSAAFLLCDFLYRNYPWRQPLKNHVWSLLCFWPTAQPLFVFLLPVAFKLLYDTCTLPTMSLCFLIVWIFIVTNRLLRDDSCTVMSSELAKERPVTINCLSYIEHCLLLIMTSIHYPAFFSACFYAFWGLLFYYALQYDLFIDKAIQFVIFSFFIISCLMMVLVHMNTICDKIIKEWEEKEEAYSKKVILRLKEELGKLPQQPGPVYDRLALDVPFLQQEARILQNAKYVDWKIKDELKSAANKQKFMEFRESLHDYKPYSRECCIS
ncbi:hypothetical protein TNIN_361221 [Trichonephila inaurata madagascariensis]|uniref:Uncharacterized protein n=1 Tax=Trichonephila inaurata madagascariensis TaxID=2747483 RepID=A0A8X6X5Z3_9ARAC|nr:hypothetical protein TNIN_361221 [Trichonephila inaurata madagascariensis]